MDGGNSDSLERVAKVWRSRRGLGEITKSARCTIIGVKNAGSFRRLKARDTSCAARLFFLVGMGRSSGI
jgi:hypothetical protein